MPNVLVCGGRRAAQGIIPIIHGFMKIGCGVLYLSTRKPGTKCDPLDDIHEKLTKLVKEFQPSVLFWCMCKQDAPPGIVETVHKAKADCKCVFHSFDDPHQIDDSGSPWSLQFDHAVTCCTDSVKWYGDRGIPALMFWPPPCLDMHGKAIFAHNKNAECELSFVGTNVYPKEKYPHVVASRADIIRAVGGLGKLKIYGPCSGEKRHDWGGPHGPTEYAHCFMGEVQYQDLPAIYEASAINLSSHVRPDGYQYLNERSINAMGSGGFVLCDRVNGMDELFKDGVHWDTWGSLDELKDKAEYWLSHPSARKRVAAAGRELVMAKYNNVEHAKAVMELCRG